MSDYGLYDTNRIILIQFTLPACVTVCVKYDGVGMGVGEGKGKERLYVYTYVHVVL